MSDAEAKFASEFAADLENLHREDVFTDLQMATVRRLTPVTADGLPDESRPVVYICETTLVSQMGPIPIQSPIEAGSVKEAFEKFPEAVRVAVERLNERAKELRREEASRIVVPSGGMPPEIPPGGGRPGGGGLIFDR